MSGSLEKLTIIPYEDSRYDVAAGDPYVALINPEQIGEELKLEYTDVGPDGRTLDTKVFKMVPSDKLSLKFLFDGTGVINGATSIFDTISTAITGAATGTKSTGGTVKEQITAFKAVTADFISSTHEPPFLKIYWGDIVFKGRMTSLKITYTLFKPSGEPLRAIGEAVFEETLDRLTQNNEENTNSPDLTHIRTVQKGETLPAMCHRIYKDSKLYLQVAKVNGLSNYRKLEAGDKLFFPPIKDED